MKDKLLKLGRHTLIYGIGSALTAAGGFLLIPLYTHVLSPQQYGVLELLNRTADILILIVMAGVRQAFIRFYFDHDDSNWHKTVVATTLAFILVTSVTIMLLLLPLRDVLANFLFKSSESGYLFIFIFIWIPLILTVRIGMAYLQVQMKSFKYVMINILQFVALITSNIILVYFYRKGIVGIFVTNIWIAASVAIGFLLFFTKWTRFKISFPLIKELLKFGLPYLPTAFFMFLINSSDRYFLTMFSSLESVGIYALSYKIGMFGIALLMDPFGKVWGPFLFENYNTEEGSQLISKVFTLYTLASVSVGLAVSVAAPVIIPLISGEAFHSAYKLVPFICLAAIFYGMASLSDAGILISKKTGYKPFIFGSASIIGIGLNLILIPRFGALGASITLALTFFSLLIINYVVANRYYAIKVEYRKFILIFSTATIVYIFSSYVRGFGDEFGYMKGYSILSFLIFPAILWFGGLFSNNEKIILKNLIAKRSSL